MTRAVDAIDLAERADRPQSKTPITKFIFENELVPHGWSPHKAGWWVWDDELGIPLHRVIFDTEDAALQHVADWASKFEGS